MIQPVHSHGSQTAAQACVSKGLVGSVPQAAASADLRRLGSALTTLQGLVRSLLADAKKEGVTVEGSSRMEPELNALISLVAAAEKEGGMDVRGMDAAWAFVASTLRTMGRVHDDLARKRGADKQAAADALLQKEQALMEQVARAKADADAAHAKVRRWLVLRSWVLHCILKIVACRNI